MLFLSIVQKLRCSWVVTAHQLVSHVGTRPANHISPPSRCLPAQGLLSYVSPLQLISQPATSQKAASRPSSARATGVNGKQQDSAIAGISTASTANPGLPEELLRLADASAPVSLPPPGSVPAGSLDNRELDKLVGTLGRNKATWRRALVLSQWLQDSGHVLDDRLCTTVCIGVDT